ncbi:sulfotransferase family protein [Gloeothece verrucosa]|nr:sulfotransferase family protein [Gloeothece verrucosa]
MFVGSDSPDLDSPSGNQEDALARLVHNRLMGRNGLGKICNWDNPRYVLGSNPDAVQHIKAYINFRIRNHTGSWGLKDPRLSFLIEPWHMATQAMPVYWIHIYRENKDAMVRSLIAMLPAKLRYCKDDQGLYRLAANWAETYVLAIELGFARIGIQPYQLTYEELLTLEGQARLSKQFKFQVPIRCIRPDLNRKGDRTFC